jgi:hypothetical protein
MVAVLVGLLIISLLSETAVHLLSRLKVPLFGGITLYDSKNMGLRFDLRAMARDPHAIPGFIPLGSHGKCKLDRRFLERVYGCNQVEIDQRYFRLLPGKRIGPLRNNIRVFRDGCRFVVLDLYHQLDNALRRSF